jgi:hypothetical protein
MDARTFEARMREYAPTNEIEQELALQEMLQSIVLAALSRSGFFKSALFHGGTCLRLVHGLARFSEDLHFLLKEADPHFEWSPYLAAIQQDCAASGIVMEARDKSTAGTAVRKAWDVSNIRSVHRSNRLGAGRAGCAAVSARKGSSRTPAMEPGSIPVPRQTLAQVHAPTK